MGTFLYYVRISNPTMLVTLNIIAAYHEKIAQATEKKVVKILNYVATPGGNHLLPHQRHDFTHA